MKHLLLLLLIAAMPGSRTDALPCDEVVDTFFSFNRQPFLELSEIFPPERSFSPKNLKEIIEKIIDLPDGPMGSSGADYYSSWLSRVIQAKLRRRPLIEAKIEEELNRPSSTGLTLDEYDSLLSMAEAIIRIRRDIDGAELLRTDVFIPIKAEAVNRRGESSFWIPRNSLTILTHLRRSARKRAMNLSRTDIEAIGNRPLTEDEDRLDHALTRFDYDLLVLQSTVNFRKNNSRDFALKVLLDKIDAIVSEYPEFNFNSLQIRWLEFATYSMNFAIEDQTLEANLRVRAQKIMKELSLKNPTSEFMKALD